MYSSRSLLILSTSSRISLVDYGVLDWWPPPWICWWSKMDCWPRSIAFFDCDEPQELVEHICCKIDVDEANGKLKFTHRFFVDEFNLDPKYHPCTPVQPGSVLMKVDPERELNAKIKSNSKVESGYCTLCVGHVQIFWTPFVSCSWFITTQSNVLSHAFLSLRKIKVFSWNLSNILLLMSPVISAISSQMAKAMGSWSRKSQISQWIKGFFQLYTYKLQIGSANCRHNKHNWGCGRKNSKYWCLSMLSTGSECPLVEWKSWKELTADMFTAYRYT